MNIVSETFRGIHLGGLFCWKLDCVGFDLITVEAAVTLPLHPLHLRYRQLPYLQQLPNSSPLSSEFD